VTYKKKMIERKEVKIQLEKFDMNLYMYNRNKWEERVMLKERDKIFGAEYKWLFFYWRPGFKRKVHIINKFRKEKKKRN